MTARKILSIFGCFVGRSNGRWIAFTDHGSYSAEYIWDIVSQIVPEPPEILSADAIREWAKRCIAACSNGLPEPKDLAYAAFAAYAIDPPDEIIECFISAWDDSQC